MSGTQNRSRMLQKLSPVSSTAVLPIIIFKLRGVRETQECSAKFHADNSSFSIENSIAQEFRRPEFARIIN